MQSFESFVASLYVLKLAFNVLRVFLSSFYTSLCGVLCFPFVFLLSYISFDSTLVNFVVLEMCSVHKTDRVELNQDW